jgi:hypothetical protein
VKRFLLSFIGIASLLFIFIKAFPVMAAQTEEQVVDIASYANQQQVVANFSKLRLDIDIASNPNCAGATRVNIFWDRDNDVPSWQGHCVDVSGTSARFSHQPGLDEGNYRLGYSCSCDGIIPVYRNENRLYVRPITDTVTVTVNPATPAQNDHSTKINVTNCPAESIVKFHLENLQQGYSGSIEITNVDRPSQPDGSAFYDRPTSGFPAGNYVGTVRCGGKDTPIPAFTVSNVENTPTAPPPPPHPSCLQYNEALGRCEKVGTAIGALGTTDESFIVSIFVVVLSLSGGIALMVILYAGYLIMTSRGNAEQLQKGRELLTSALVGLLFIVFSIVILETLTVDVLHLPGFQRASN